MGDNPPDATTGDVHEPWRGKTFYRYRISRPPEETEALQIFESSSLYFSSPSKFNDPHEAKPRYGWGDMSWANVNYYLRLLRKREPSRSDFDHLAEAYISAENMKNPVNRADHIRQMERALTTRFQGTSMCCFCESGENPTLWSDYSDEGSGYCVGFSFDPIWTYVDTETQRQIRLYPFKVAYQYLIVDADCLESRTDVERFVQAAVLTKSIKWSAEQEWRCFRPSFPSGLQAFPHEALKKLILGPLMKNETQARLVELARSRQEPVEILQATRESDGRISLRPL